MSSKSSNTNDWPSRCTVDRVSNELLSQSRGESSVCSACNGYYGQANGQPVCLTCHAFLYASGFDAENVNLQLMSEERDDENDSDRDSGNEEPNELFYVATGGPVPIPSDAKSPTSRNTDSGMQIITNFVPQLMGVIIYYCQPFLSYILKVTLYLFR